MQVPDRICGIETEFGTVFQNQHDEMTRADFINASFFRRHIWNHCLNGLYTGRDLMTGDRLWHKNGSLIYVDFNDHPEHATAECRRLRDLVAQVKAGELIMADIFSHPFFHKKEQGHILLFKNNLSWDEEGNPLNTYGCHDNYSLPFAVTDPGINSFYSFLLPFLVTRQILDGSGTWDKNGNFLLSQRATQIKQNVAGTAIANRPMISNKATSDTGNRLQLLLGDSNILEPALLLKVGTTMLVLAITEVGGMPAMSCANPLKALHEIAVSADPHERLVVVNWARVSALDVQYLYLDYAKKYLPDAHYESEGTRQEFLAVLDLWENALEAIANRDIKWMLGRLDYVTKQYLFEQALRAKVLASPGDAAQLRRNIDILYHGISDRTIQNALNNKFASRRIVSDEEIMRAKEYPPPDTRAQLRSRFILKALEKEDNSDWFPDWSGCMCNRPFTRIALNPFDAESEEFEKFLAKLS